PWVGDAPKPSQAPKGRNSFERAEGVERRSVAQIGNLLCRRLAVGRPTKAPTPACKTLNLEL
ncbi:MAG: hypothetical protein RMK20_12115, partial [Verrucomicrobiales bacterium]|nr:hypothetical protein [Verrucomicrobiales bacterium]